MAGEADSDDIRTLLQGAMDGKITSEGSAAPSSESIAPATAAPTSTPTPAPTEPTPTVQDRGDGRDANGRFVGSKPGEPARETLTLKPQAGQQPTTQQPQSPQTAGKPPEPTAATPQQQSKHPVPPPAWFKGAGKVDWNKMPDPVRAELSEFVGNLEAERAEVAPLKEMIDQARPLLVREAGSVQEGVRQLLAFHQLSIDKPVDLALHILRARGIDLRALLSGQPQAQQPGIPQQQQQPDIASIIAQAVQRELQPLKAQIEQREDQQHHDTIQAFAADPAHPYFNDVRVQMGHLLKAGQATTLDEAYDQATWAHPVIRQTLLAKQAEDAANTRAAEVLKAQQASQASLTGSPTPGAISSVQGGSDGSIRGDLLAAMRQQTGAV
jgi:hypothetical protein